MLATAHNFITVPQQPLNIHRDINPVKNYYFKYLFRVRARTLFMYFYMFYNNNAQRKRRSHCTYSYVHPRR